MRIVRWVPVVAAVLCLLSVGTLAQPSAWQPGGKVVVNGKTVEGAQFLKQGRHCLFPVLAIASSLGKKATFEVATGVVTFEGRRSTPRSLVVMDGQPYVSGGDLVRIMPGVEYGVQADRAVLAYGPRPTMPKGGDGPSGGVASGAILVYFTADW